MGEVDEKQPQDERIKNKKIHADPHMRLETRKNVKLRCCFGITFDRTRSKESPAENRRGRICPWLIWNQSSNNIYNPRDLFRQRNCRVTHPHRAPYWGVVAMAFRTSDLDTLFIHISCFSPLSFSLLRVARRVVKSLNLVLTFRRAWKSPVTIRCVNSW